MTKAYLHKILDTTQSQQFGVGFLLHGNRNDLDHVFVLFFLGGHFYLPLGSDADRQSLSEFQARSNSAGGT